MPLFKKRSIYVPTIWGTLFLVAIISFISYLLLIRTYIFLAPEKEPRSKILVVEGWIDEISVGNALKLYQSRDYEYLIITGVPITQWTFSSPFTNMADATAESIKRMYFTDTLYRVIVPSNILRDRTYTSALALKMKLEEWQLPYKDFDLYTVGAHARRSYLVYRKAFHDDRYIGLIADTDSSFDPKEWFGTSRGFRIVIGELISYFYAYLFFHPDENHYKQLIQNGHYADDIRDKRAEKDRLFSDTISSPLNIADINTFRGLPYFEVNPDYKISAFVKPDTVSAPFFMHTTTERKPRYRKFGDLHFELNNTQLSLEVYQNLDLLEKNPDYRGLFVPFKDSTNGEQTYGGGRYLDVQIPFGDSVVIDFNEVYNPYCAYDEKWSCPLVPSVNYLPVAVRAGEKAYKKPNS